MKAHIYKFNVFLDKVYFYQFDIKYFLYDGTYLIIETDDDNHFVYYNRSGLIHGVYVFFKRLSEREINAIANYLRGKLAIN